MTRQKATNYFSHDSNARNDEKLVRLRMRHGAAGYGVYFMILERLREEADYTSAKDYNMIAFDLRVDASLVKSVVEDFGLFAFAQNGERFYSESFKKRMDAKDNTSRLLSEAGKKGNAKRWKSDDENTEDSLVMQNVSPGDSLVMQNVSQVKKVKKVKKEESENIARSREENVNDLYLEKFFRSNNEQIDALLISLGLSPGDKDKLRKVAEEVTNEWKISEASHTGYHDWTSHLISTIRIKLQKNKPKASAKEEQIQKGREEYERQQAEQSRKRDEMYHTSVSYEEAKKSEEYRRAMAEA